MRKPALVLFVALVVLMALPAPALGAIRIRKIAFNPPGSDTGANTHLNREFVLIKNVGANKKALGDWRLHDRGRDHVYRFTDIVLGPDEYLRLHTGRGQDQATTGCNGDCFTFYDLYWDLDNYVWNNNGDRATLKNASGDVIDRCRYGSTADSPKRC